MRCHSGFKRRLRDPFPVFAKKATKHASIAHFVKRIGNLRPSLLFKRGNLRRRPWIRPEDADIVKYKAPLLGKRTFDAFDLACHKPDITAD